MRVRCKFWRFDNPASDGSIISQQVFEAYLRSPEYKEIISGKPSIFLDNNPNNITIIVNSKYNNLFLFK